MANAFTLDNSTIGGMLQTQREFSGISQNDLSNRLSYANANFISMVENGRSKVPIGKIHQWIDAIGLDKTWAAVILKYTYPDTYGTVVQLIARMGQEWNGKDYAEIDVEIETFAKNERKRLKGA